MPIRVGTLAEAAMLTGPLATRRELLCRAADAGLDRVFVADPISFHDGMGMNGGQTIFALVRYPHMAR